MAHLRAVLNNVRQRAVLAGRMGTGSLMILGERMLKAAIVILAIFSVMGKFGSTQRSSCRTGYWRYRHRFRRAKYARRIFSVASRYWATK